MSVYSHPDRDPRGHIVSICFRAKRVDGRFDSDDEILETKAFNIDEIRNLELEFNHKEMLKDVEMI